MFFVSLTKLRDIRDSKYVFSHITKEQFSFLSNKNSRKGKIYMEYRFISDEINERVFRYTFSYPRDGKDLCQLIFQLELLIDKERTIGDINSLNIIRLRVSAPNEFSIVLLGKNQRILDYIEKYGAVLTEEKEFELSEDLLGYLMKKEEDNLYYFGVCSPEYMAERDRRREAVKKRRELDRKFNEMMK